MPDDTPDGAAQAAAPGKDASAADALGALGEDLAALIEDARTYAEAEIAFQKARAKFAGKTAGRALIQVVLALVLLHIALLTLAVGAVIALAPLLTVWGAIALVVGVMLAGVAGLVLAARKQGAQLAALFDHSRSSGA
jgi:hypothetical protein